MRDNRLAGRSIARTRSIPARCFRERIPTRLSSREILEGSRQSLPLLQSRRLAKPTMTKDSEKAWSVGSGTRAKITRADMMKVIKRAMMMQHPLMKMETIQSEVSLVVVAC